MGLGPKEPTKLFPPDLIPSSCAFFYDVTRFPGWKASVFESPLYSILAFIYISCTPSSNLSKTIGFVLERTLVAGRSVEGIKEPQSSKYLFFHLLHARL